MWTLIENYRSFTKNLVPDVFLKFLIRIIVLVLLQNFTRKKHDEKKGSLFFRKHRTLPLTKVYLRDFFFIDGQDSFVEKERLNRCILIRDCDRIFLI